MYQKTGATLYKSKSVRHFKNRCDTLESGETLTRSELDNEIYETEQTLRHLECIGEMATALKVADYLDWLIAERRRIPDLWIVPK